MELKQERGSGVPLERVDQSPSQESEGQISSSKVGKMSHEQIAAIQNSCRSGKTIAQISNETGIPRSTVGYHTKKIRNEKLQTRSRAISDPSKTSREVAEQVNITPRQVSRLRKDAKLQAENEVILQHAKDSKKSIVERGEVIPVVEKGEMNPKTPEPGKLPENEGQKSFLPQVIGQRGLKKSLGPICQNCKRNGDFLHSIIISGCPGMGKTFIAKELARSCGKTLSSEFNGACSDPDSLMEILANVPPFGFAFIDEIHALSAKVQEKLLPFLDGIEEMRRGEFKSKGEGQGKVSPITIICSTNQPQSVLKTLISRLWHFRLLPYSLDDLVKIARKVHVDRGIFICHEGALRLAQTAWGNPRKLERQISKMIAGIPMCKKISPELVEKFLEQEGVDEDGLEEHHRNYLMALLKAHPSGLSLDSLSKILQISSEDIQGFIEDPLLKFRYLSIENKRRLTTNGLKRAMNIQP